MLRRGDDLSGGGRNETWRSLRLGSPGLLKDVVRLAGCAAVMRKVSACGLSGEVCICVCGCGCVIMGAGRGCSNAVERLRGTCAGDTAELIMLMSMLFLLSTGFEDCSASRIRWSIALYV